MEVPSDAAAGQSGPPDLPTMDVVYKTSSRSSLSRRPPPATGDGVTPYLDVMTICSSTHASEGETQLPPIEALRSRSTDPPPSPRSR